MRLLITGGLGYIGGRLATHLSDTEASWDIRIFTRRAREQVPAWAEQMEVVQGDVRDPDAVARATEEVDGVVHLAAVDENKSAHDVELAQEVNVGGTLRLLEACHVGGVERFVYFSTFHVYGPHASGRICEDTPARPVHPYAFTHRAAEDLVAWFDHEHGLRGLILRVSNGYGYPADRLADRWTLVFNDLCRQAVRDRKLQIRSSGRQHRDFVALSDIARATRHALRLDPRDWGDGLFNLGGGNSMSILQIARRIASVHEERTGMQLEIETGAVRKDERTDPVDYDISKFLGTGFTLSSPMRDEIAGTLDLCERIESEVQ